MFAGLDEHGLVNAAGQGVAGGDKTAFAQGQVAVDQFVHGRFLAGIFPVPEAFFNKCAVFVYFPGAFFIYQFLVAKGNGQVIGEMIIHYGFIGFFQVFHGPSQVIHVCVYGRFIVSCVHFKLFLH